MFKKLTTQHAQEMWYCEKRILNTQIGSFATYEDPLLIIHNMSFKQPNTQPKIIPHYGKGDLSDLPAINPETHFNVTDNPLDKSGVIEDPITSELNLVSLIKDGDDLKWQYINDETLWYDSLDKIGTSPFIIIDNIFAIHKCVFNATNKYLRRVKFSTKDYIIILSLVTDGDTQSAIESAKPPSTTAIKYEIETLDIRPYTPNKEVREVFLRRIENPSKLKLHTYLRDSSGSYYYYKIVTIKSYGYKL